MPKFVIERRIPNAGDLSGQELHNIAAQSNAVLTEMRGEGKQVQWLQSYVSPDAIHCVYIADRRELVEEHARRGCFPADAIFQVNANIDPTTGE
jgi:hypothetical protein